MDKQQLIDIGALSNNLMREIDVWTDIFESKKEGVSNSNASKLGVPGQRRSLSKTKNYPVSAIKTRIDDNRPKILLARRAYQW